MNLQTVKARARWVPCYALWRVEHPLTGIVLFTDFPHDIAVAMIHKYVLPRHVELAREREASCSDA